MTKSKLPYERDTALVLKDRGLIGLEIILLKDEVPSTEEAINEAIRKPGNALAGYVVRPEYIDSVVKQLTDFQRQYETYKYYAQVFEGCHDPYTLEAVITDYFLFQSNQFTATQPPGRYYSVGGNIHIFVTGFENNSQARYHLEDMWRRRYGELAFWSISVEETDNNVYFMTESLESAKKFYTWYYHEFIAKTLKRLQEQEE